MTDQEQSGLAGSAAIEGAATRPRGEMERRVDLYLLALPTPASEPTS